MASYNSQPFDATLVTSLFQLAGLSMCKRACWHPHVSAGNPCVIAPVGDMTDAARQRFYVAIHLISEQITIARLHKFKITHSTSSECLRNPGHCPRQPGASTSTVGGLEPFGECGPGNIYYTFRCTFELYLYCVSRPAKHRRSPPLKLKRH